MIKQILYRSKLQSGKNPKKKSPAANRSSGLLGGNAVTPRRVILRKVLSPTKKIRTSPTYRIVSKFDSTTSGQPNTAMELYTFCYVKRNNFHGKYIPLLSINPLFTGLLGGALLSALTFLENYANFETFSS